MEKKIQDLKYLTINNKSTLTEMNQTFFPSLTHKELMSLHDMKLKTNYTIRNNINNNFHRNFHTEIMKTNLKENSLYSSLYKDSSTYTKTESMLPSLRKGKNEPIVNLCMDPKLLNTIKNKSINKNIKINYKNIFNNTNNISKKYNISNISTSGNASPSIKSIKYSVLDKLKSNSVDYNSSLFNLEKDDTSLSFQKQQKYNNSIDIKNEFNKKFVSSLNPLYSSLKQDILSEFNKKGKDINYLKFILMKNKKDIEIEEETRASQIERLDQILFSIQTLQNLFNKYQASKYEYLNYLQREISKENEKNKILNEEKITLMKDIYIIRHKTMRLENRFKNYLNDKFFLLSVKNHSFKLEKFDQEERLDYQNDLKKLEILNIMLKMTSKEFANNQIEKDHTRTSRLIKRQEMFNKNINTPSSKFNNYKIFQRQNTKRLSSKRSINNVGYNPLFSVSKKSVLSRNLESKPIYEDVFYFNKDLQQTTQKIQDSLDEYNNKSKELTILKQNLAETIKEIKDKVDYELHLKEEVIIYNKNLENIKKLNNGLINYKSYLKHIFILNLNKGKVLEKINLIMNNIEQSKDKVLLDFISNNFGEYHTYLITGLDKLKLIERVFEFLFMFKTNKRNEGNKKYYEIQKQIDENNRKMMSKRKQDFIKNKFNLLIQKVVDKNNKIIFLQKRKVGKDMRIYLKKDKIEKNDNDEDDDYFGNFDFF